jgi:hypothetical protein
MISEVYGHDNQGGVYDGYSFHDKTFYGFKLLDSTGTCTVTTIRSGDSTPIVLPSWSAPGYIDSLALSTVSAQPDDYKAYMWTVDALTFRFNETTGHLEMVVY